MLLSSARVQLRFLQVLRVLPLPRLTCSWRSFVHLHIVKSYTPAHASTKQSALRCIFKLSEMLARIAFIIYLLPVFPATESVCHGSRTSYRAEFMGELVQNDKVLLGHVFATFPVLNFTHCFTECKIDCRCRSFNLPISGQGICELNNADNSSVLMKPRRGWRYHHLKGSEVRQGSVSE